MSATMSAAEAAEICAFGGVPVFPCAEDKRPCCAGGFKSATTDESLWPIMFADPRAALVGIPTGPVSGFDVLDIDPKNGGLEWLRANESRLPVTLRVHTRSGGVHLYFQHAPGLRNSASRIAPGIDVRSEGGYVIAWRFAGFFCNNEPAAKWPDWLLIEAMRRQHRATSAPAPQDLAPPSAADLIALLTTMKNPADVTRDDYCAVNLAVQGSMRALDVLGTLDPNDAEDIRHAAAEWSARWEGPHPSDAETELGRWESDWSIRTNDVSGFRHLLAIAARCGCDVSPWTVAAAVAEFGALPDEPENCSSAVKSDTGTTIPPVDDGPAELTEDCVARAFARSHLNRLAYDHTQGRWFIFDGAIWRPDERARARWALREYVSIERARSGNADRSTATGGFLRSVERLARDDPSVAVSASVWDPDKWLLGVPGGYVDLRTGSRHDGDASKYLSLSASVAPEAGTPDLWMRYLEFITDGDSEHRDWLQRFVGYCLTGDVTEEILAFFYGLSGTGKGTFLGTLGRIVAAYGFQVPADFFTTNTKLNAEYYRARMAGKRVVFASETESGASLAGALVKEMTGNEGKISGRHPAGQPFEFEMHGKLIIASNKQPQLRGSPEGLVRRLRVVPFDRKPPKVDKGFKDALVPEFPRILHWMIDGCLAWQKQGLGWSEPVRRASAAYFDNQDALGSWASERAVCGAGAQGTRAELYADYSIWAKSSGEAPMASREFYETLRQRFGAVDKMSHGTRGLQGIGLRRDSAAAEFAPVSAADLPSVH